MNRRESFNKIRNGLVVALGTAIGFCAKLFGASSRWSWPGYPDEGELRKHLVSSPNHPEITASSVNSMTFDQCVAAHDRSHQRRGDKPRWGSARNVPGTGSGNSQSAAPDYMGNPSNNPKGGRSVSRKSSSGSGSSERLKNPLKRRR